MNDWITSGLEILGWAVAIWLLLALAGFAPMLLLLFVRLQLEEDPRRMDQVLRQAESVVGESWLVENGFLAEGVIRPLGIAIALYRHVEDRTALAVYVGNGNIDFVTHFPNHVGITTTKACNGVVAPLSPGSIMQCLPSVTHEERWQAHCEAVAVIRHETCLQEVPLNAIHEEFAHAVQRQCRHICSRPWLILTLPYRYFVTQWRYRNVRVTEQLKRGWVVPDRLARQAREQ